MTLISNSKNYEVPWYDWIFGLPPSSGILKNTTFRKLDLFPSSDKESERQLLCWIH
jgi:hypothetical protein